MAQMLYLPDGDSVALFDEHTDFLRLVYDRLGNDAARYVEDLFEELANHRSAGAEVLELIENAQQELFQNRFSQEKLTDLMAQITHILIKI